jgi:serine O-acetyltransferase
MRAEPLFRPCEPGMAPHPNSVMSVTTSLRRVVYNHNAMLKEDFHRAYRLTKGNRTRRIVDCLRSPGFRAVVIYRMRHWLRDQPFMVRLFLRPLLALPAHRMRWKWGIDISADAEIGPGFQIIHYGGIFVASDVVAGSGLTITHDVTFGFSRARNIQGFPTLGNNVFIAPGAKLAGRIHIGNNVKIGANAVVEKDVPDHAVVQVRPALVVTYQQEQASITPLPESNILSHPSAA